MKLLATCTILYKGDKLNINQNDLEIWEAKGAELAENLTEPLQESEDSLIEGEINWGEFSDEDIAAFLASENHFDSVPRVAGIAILESLKFDPNAEAE